MQELSIYQVIENRATVLGRIREYFAEQGVFEVDVPVLGKRTVSDPHIQALEVSLGAQPGYLQTSPEYFMKRLLAQGIGDIYYLGRAFRQDEQGPKHNPEFTMLEWYRTESTDEALMDDVDELFAYLLPGSDIQATRVAYGDLFKQELGVDPHTCSAEQLRHLAKEILDVQFDDERKSTWLDLLFSHQIEPKLQALTYVYDYPECQCALARVVKQGGIQVAKRFEVFWKGVELANAYWELTDAGQQKARFEKDNEVRKAHGLAQVQTDEQFIRALEQGLPECAGIALGVDRLLMCMLDQQDVRRVMPFAFDEL